MSPQHSLIEALLVGLLDQCPASGANDVDVEAHGDLLVRLLGYCVVNNLPDTCRAGLFRKRSLAVVVGMFEENEVLSNSHLRWTTK